MKIKRINIALEENELKLLNDIKKEEGLSSQDETVSFLIKNHKK